jgi:hypothetical protein
MDIEVFALCDAATSDQSGKLNVLGTFDTIYAQQTPAGHPAAAVALRLRLSRSEFGKHQIRLLLIDDDGKTVGPDINGEFETAPANEAETACVNFVFNLQALPLPSYGRMHFDLAVDRNQLGRLPLYVRPIPGRPGPAHLPAN